MVVGLIQLLSLLVLNLLGSKCLDPVSGHSTIHETLTSLIEDVVSPLLSGHDGIKLVHPMLSILVHQFRIVSFGLELVHLVHVALVNRRPKADASMTLHLLPLDLLVQVVPQLRVHPGYSIRLNRLIDGRQAVGVLSGVDRLLLNESRSMRRVAPLLLLLVNIDQVLDVGLLIELLLVSAFRWLSQGNLRIGDVVFTCENLRRDVRWYNR